MLRLDARGYNIKKHHHPHKRAILDGKITIREATTLKTFRDETLLSTTKSSTHSRPDQLCDSFKTVSARVTEQYHISSSTVLLAQWRHSTAHAKRLWRLHNSAPLKKKARNSSVSHPFRQDSLSLSAAKDVDGYLMWK